MALLGHLVVVQGFLREKDYPLPQEGEFTIGRDRHLSIPILARTVSRLHAKITFRNGVYSITDQESKSGLLVNDRKVTMTVLRHNDLIQIGHVKFRFMMQEPPKPHVEPPTEAVSAPVVIPPRPVPLPPAEASDSGIRYRQSEIVTSSFTAEELAFVGRTIGGTKLIAMLARGRRTVIYKGTQASHNRVVAFKMLRPEAAAKADIVAWFIAGARRASELRHEDIVGPLGGGSEEGVIFLYMPFMENGSAQQRFSGTVEEGIPAVKRALEALVHITRALEFAQTSGILHLGLRPAKILFNELRRAKLAGLGFDNSAAAPGAQVTPDIEAYFAPEQLGGKRDLTQEADIFSLGATFYYMLTGRHPQRDRRQRLPSPKLVNRVIPDSICRIAEKMVDPAIETRYRSYGQLLHDLRWALRGEAWPHA